MIGKNLQLIKVNILSGVTVALTMMPEAIAFALFAQLSPLTGLYAAFILSLVTALLGGRPGMVSGASGALAIVTVSLVAKHGVQYLFATVILMGLLQILFSLVKLGKVIRMVPHPVMLGFVNGLAIVTLIAQAEHFKLNRLGPGPHWIQGTELYTLLGLTFLTLGIIYLAPKVTRLLPSSLIGILLVSGLKILCNIKTLTVGDLGSIAGGLPSFALPQVALTWQTLEIIFPYAFIMATIGLLLSLLTLNLMDSLTDTHGNPNRECLAQGIGNMIAGLFGSMGGCGMIGQSMININNEALQRLAGISSALFILASIVFGSSLIEGIPLAALIAVMLFVAEKTFAWSSLKNLHKIPRSDACTLIVVTLITIWTNIAVAVILGVIISALIFAWKQAQHLQSTHHIDPHGWKRYTLEGALFFASTTQFQSLFTPQEDPSDVVIDFQNATLADHSAIEAIDKLALGYEKMGKRLHLCHLSPASFKLLNTAKPLLKVKTLTEIDYYVVAKKLG